MKPNRYYEVVNPSDRDAQHIMTRLEMLGTAKAVRFEGLPEEPKPKTFDEASYTEALINNEVATAELHDAEAERRIFNWLAKLGVALIPVGIGLSVFVSMFFLFTLVGAAAFTFMGVSGRMNDSLQEKRRHEIAARHKMGRQFELKMDHQLQLTSREDSNDNQ